MAHAAHDGPQAGVEVEGSSAGLTLTLMGRVLTDLEAYGQLARRTLRSRGSAGAVPGDDEVTG